jgi:hypothetical protein
MSDNRKPSSPELTPAERDDLLRRILEAVEKDQRKRWLEIICAIVLSLATMGWRANLSFGRGQQGEQRLLATAVAHDAAADLRRFHVS